MKFMRRPDLGNLTRVEIAVQAFLRMGVYGEITRLAQSYQVSRLFIYKLVWQLLTVYALRVCEPSSVQTIRKGCRSHTDKTLYNGYNLLYFWMLWTISV
jgi:hypothetical protein